MRNAGGWISNGYGYGFGYPCKTSTVPTAMCIMNKQLTGHQAWTARAHPWTVYRNFPNRVHPWSPDDTVVALVFEPTIKTFWLLELRKNIPHLTRSHCTVLKNACVLMSSNPRSKSCTPWSFWQQPKRSLAFLFKNPLSMDAAFTDSDLGIRMVRSRITETEFFS